MWLGGQGTAQNADINCKKKDSLLPRSVILTIICPLPSNTLELEVSSLKLWLKFDPTDMMDIYGGT